MAEIQVGEGHNGGIISAERGDVFVVRLSENPTTGYRWSLAGGEPALLQLQSDDFTPGTGIGSAGTRVLRYLAAGAGETTLRLQLARSWETAAPRSQFVIRVTIGR
jgi:predicted secreted protein